jgi:hypothetical protein
VARQAFDKFEAHTFDASLVAEADASSGSSPCLPEGTEFGDAADRPFVSRAEGVRSVRGILVAIALEAAVALCLYCTWQVWHLMR